MDAYRKQLIRAVKSYPSLWDPTNKDYKCKEQRYEIWQEIEANHPPPKVPGAKPYAKAVWGQLTKCFCNALKRHQINRMRSEGKRRSNPKAKNWKFQQEMMFLLPAKINRKAFGQMGLYQSGDDADESSESLSASFSANAHLDGAHDEQLDGVTAGTSSLSDHHHHQGYLDASNDGSEGEPADVKNVLVPLLGDHDGEGEDEVVTEARAVRVKARTSGRKRRKVVIPTTEMDEEFLRASDEDEMMMQVVRHGPRGKKNKADGSDRLNFFRSVMPQVDVMTDDEFLDFQVDVLQILLKRRGPRVPETTAATADDGF